MQNNQKNVPLSSCMLKCSGIYICSKPLKHQTKLLSEVSQVDFVTLFTNTFRLRFHITLLYL